MKQADMKGSSDNVIGRSPDLDEFRASNAAGFAFEYQTADGGKAKFYSVNPGATVGDTLGEIVCIADIIEALARSIVERLEGKDSVVVQLGYAVLRFSEQANALASSALCAKWRQP